MHGCQFFKEKKLSTDPFSHIFADTNYRYSFLVSWDSIFRARSCHTCKKNRFQSQSHQFLCEFQCVFTACSHMCRRLQWAVKKKKKMQRIGIDTDISAEPILNYKILGAEPFYPFCINRCVIIHFDYSFCLKGL